MAISKATGAAFGFGALGAAGGFLQALRAEKGATRFRRRQRKAIAEAERVAGERVSRVEQSELFRGARQFIEGTFQDAVGTPLAQDFAKSIRAAQSARGVFSGAAAEAGEASGVAAFAQQLRANLLPSALSFSQFPETLRAQILSSEVPLRVAASTGAALPGLAPQQTFDPLSAALTQGISGAAGGFQLGLAAENADLLGNLLNRQQEQPDLAAQRRLRALRFSRLGDIDRGAQRADLLELLRGLA
ncbi:MAG: hypothetical protein L0099_07255 [Acidobacteria bacterium]|nr:hypothetical protein [Acidobacteriota bacterium]